MRNLNGTAVRRYTDAFRFSLQILTFEINPK